MEDNLSKLEIDRPVDEKSLLEQKDLERTRFVQRILEQRQAASLEEEKVLLEWQSPSRIFKKRPKEYFTTIGAIIVLVCIILLFVQEFALIAVVIAMAFVAFVFATVEPESAKHEISTRGIRTGGKIYRWDELGRYWFETIDSHLVLNVETMLSFPRRLIMLSGKLPEQTFKDYLSPYLLLEKPEPGFVDKASNWLSEKVPLEGN